MYFYMIMPVGADAQAKEKQEIISKLAALEDIHAHLPGYSAKNTSFNLKSTLDELMGAEFVIADLSLERPSCYYELGLAQALYKKVFIIAHDGTDIHQTAQRNETSFFGDLPDFEKLVRGIVASRVPRA